MPLPHTHARAHPQSFACFFSVQNRPRRSVASLGSHLLEAATEVNVSAVIMLRRKAIQIMRRIRRRTCAAHFDGLQPKSANLPDGSTALPWPQPQVSEEPPRSHPVPGLKQSEVREVQRELRERHGTCKWMLPARLIRLAADCVAHPTRRCSANKSWGLRDATGRPPRARSRPTPINIGPLVSAVLRVITGKATAITTLISTPRSEDFQSR
jgi:hypothetical protein